MDDDHSHGVQLSLLSGFVAKERVPDPHSGVVLAAALAGGPGRHRFPAAASGPDL